MQHVDELGDNSNEQMTPAQHHECSLEQADGRFDLEHRSNAGDASDLYGAPYATASGNATASDSRWWDGDGSGLEIESVSAPGPEMTVTTGTRPDPASRSGAPGARGPRDGLASRSGGGDAAVTRR